MESSKICRLCLRDNSECIELFGETQNEHEINKIIGQHFWFEPMESDNYSNLICVSCWDCLKTFHEFYLIIKEAQEHLLKNTISQETVDDENFADIKTEANVKEESTEFLKNDFIEDEEDDDAFDNDEEIDYDDDDDDEDDEDYIYETPSDAKESNPDPKGKHQNRSNRKSAKRSDIEPTIKPRRGRPPKNRTDSPKCKKYKPRVTKSIEKREEEHEKKIEMRGRRNDEDQRIREFFKLECQMCPTKFDTFVAVKVHYRRVHTIHRGYIMCCNKKLIRRCDILQHLSWHLNPDEFRCSICSKVYNDKYGLRLHMFKHAPEEDRSFKCDICGRGYATKGKLSHHLTISHISEGGKMHKCKQCGKAFALHSILQSHIRRVHESYYATVCDICAKVFKSKSQCTIHRTTQHSDDKPQKIQCSLCGAWLKNEISLNCHVRRSHHRIPQPCKICGKVSPNKDALRNHMRYVHELKRLHKCDYCDKAFKQKVALKEHMASHTGATLYVCPYCPKTFNSNANMHSHRKTKHPMEWERDRNVRMGPTQT